MGRVWLISDLINIIVLFYLIFNIYKRMHYVNVKGVLELILISAMLGPFFTAICGFMWFIERYV